MSARMEEFTNGPDGVVVDWTAEPNFYFSTEVDAFNTLIDLGEQLGAARRQVDETMRYLTAAVIAARQPDKAGRRTAVKAIMDHSGLARQTVYNMLGEKADDGAARTGE